MGRYFSIISVSQLLTPDGFEIKVITLGLCHLKLHWTIYEPWVHHIAVKRRGLWVMEDAHWCFVDIYIIDEVHEGDHHDHHFNWPDWQICDTRFFRFKGTVENRRATSDSPIFGKHYPGFCQDLALTEPWTWKGAEPPEYVLLFEEPWS